LTRKRSQEDERGKLKKEQSLVLKTQRAQTMVPLAYVDRVYSEKLRKLHHETKMAKKAIRKMHNRMIDS